MNNEEKSIEWFKTSEKMPSHNKYILMTDASGNMSTGTIEHLELKFSESGDFVFPAWRELPDKPDWL